MSDLADEPGLEGMGGGSSRGCSSAHASAALRPAISRCRPPVGDFVAPASGLGGEVVGVGKGVTAKKAYRRYGEGWHNGGTHRSR